MPKKEVDVKLNMKKEYLLNTLRIKITKASVAREIKATSKAYKAGKKMGIWKAAQKSRAVRKKKKR